MQAFTYTRPTPTLSAQCHRPQPLRVTATLRTVKGTSTRPSSTGLTLPKLQETLKSVLSLPRILQKPGLTKPAEDSGAGFDSDILVMVGLSTAVAFICSIDRSVDTKFT
jgi:hypothetical protein